MASPLVSYLKWRVLDPISGQVIIDPLPHPHQSSFKTFIAQNGTTGSSMIGEFTIPLFGPGTPQYAQYKFLYDKLGLSFMQRVEAYISTSSVDTAGVRDDPVFTGIITKLPQDLNNYSLQGSDSLKLAELAATGRMEAFSGRTDQLFTYALKVYGLVFADDFTSSSLSNYTNTGAWSLTTDQGYNAIKAAQAVCTLTSKTLFTNPYYADCVVNADFHTNGPNGAGDPTQSVSVVAAGTIKGTADINFTSSTSQYSVDISILDTGTTKAVVKNVITNQTADLHLQLRLIGVQQGASYTWRLLINGTDNNCVYTYTATPSGAVGLIGGNILASTSCWVHGAPGSAFLFENKTALFQPGQVITGTQSLDQVLSLQPPIDLYNLAATTEQAQFRKNPKAGLTQDTMDFGKPVGTDLSNSVTLSEKENIIDISIEPNAEPIHTALIAASAPGPDHQGIHWRYNIAAIKQFGLLYGSAPLHSSVDSWAIRRQADSILINRATPMQAKRLTVLRDINHARTLQLNNTTGLRYREGDFVTLDVPRLGIIKEKAQIIGFTFVEGDPSMEVILDQYPRHLDRIIQLDRLKRTVDHLMKSTEDVTGFQSSAGIIFDRRIVVPTNPYKAQAHQSSAQAAIANITFAKVVLQAEDYDTSASFDNVTNYRFTAKVSGYYWIAGTVPWSTGAAAMPRGITTIYKGGVEVATTRGQGNIIANQTASIASTPTVLYLKLGEYVELFAWQATGGNLAPVNSAGDVAVLTVHLWSL